MGYIYMERLSYFPFNKTVYFWLEPLVPEGVPDVGSEMFGPDGSSGPGFDVHFQLGFCAGTTCGEPNKVLITCDSFWNDGARDHLGCRVNVELGLVVRGAGVVAAGEVPPVLDCVCADLGRICPTLRHVFHPDYSVKDGGKGCGVRSDIVAIALLEIPIE